MHQVIVVGIDFSPGSYAALHEALAMAVTEHTKEVHIVHVQSLAAIANSGYLWPIATEQDEDLDRLRSVARDALKMFEDTVRVFVHASIGSPARDLADLAAEIGADLIVVGPPARGFDRIFFGSVAARLAHIAGCSVLMVREHQPSKTRCAECIAVRERTNRAALWCTEHSGREVYSEILTPSAVVGSRPPQTRDEQQTRQR